jgi:hypothetical protein
MRLLFFATILCLNYGCNSLSSNQNQDMVNFDHNREEKTVKVFFGDSFFTSYIYTSEYYKPVLYPLITKSNKVLTRGFPVNPKEGERVDHPHHVGHWLNYGDVNGFDFWNHSDAIPAEKKSGYGTIYHKSVELKDKDGKLIAFTNWKDSQGNTLIEEETTFTFSQKGSKRFIDRVTKLKAVTDVLLKDNKEGFVAVRVGRELEHPNEKPGFFTDSKGIVSKIKTLNNIGVTGSYLSSEGVLEENVWGTRASWVNLSGVIENEKVSITIYDHPENIGYPTYWHARGYGLFAANPLGQEIFSKGKEVLNLEIKKDSIVTFKYRLLINNNESVDTKMIEKYAENF